VRETLTPQPINWRTFEVALRNASGDLTRPFSDELHSDGPESAKSAIKKMLHVEARGWPGALLEFRDDNGKPRIAAADDKKPPIYILKCKPKCWRLYFYIDHNRHYFVYLYAKCKKKPRSDPADATRARKIYARRLSKGNGISEFPFPDRSTV
jgi:hypothetical protein